MGKHLSRQKYLPELATLQSPTAMVGQGYLRKLSTKLLRLHSQETSAGNGVFFTIQQEILHKNSLHLLACGGFSVCSQTRIGKCERRTR